MIKKNALYIVATPIGNLADITNRALEVLREVDVILAEDTRHSKKLLQNYSIDKKIISLHEHNEERQYQKVLEMISQGMSIALISDAGTPLVSDPGFILVREAHFKGISVIPIPGPSALICAISASGIATDRFRFEGFLPVKGGARRNFISKIKDEPSTVVLYEAPHRIENLFSLLVEILGPNRRACIARELTKTFETIINDTTSNIYNLLLKDKNQQKGEFVVIIEGFKKEKNQVQEVNDLAKKAVDLLKDELPPKKVAKIVSELTDINKKDIYDYVLGQKS